MSVVIDRKSEIIAKANQLAARMTYSEELGRFRQAADKLARHSNARTLVTLVKMKKNRYSQASLRYGYDHPGVIKAKEEYDAILNQVEELPVIEQYQTSQAEVNDLLQGVLKIIMVSLPDDIRVERDVEEVKAGCGSIEGGCGSCRPR